MIFQPDVIILAGGLGTRLRGIVKDLPKPMANVQGKPFLQYILDKINELGFKRVILSVGYKKEVIKDYFKNKYKELDILYSEEDTPLGTGGALKQAEKFINSNIFIVFNGDSFIKIENIEDLLIYHRKKMAIATVVVTKVEDSSRYGVVRIEKNGKINSFQEKIENKKINTISAGIYVFSKDVFPYLKEGQSSLERDLLPKLIETKKTYSYYLKGPFIDIGTNEDYLKINNDLLFLKQLFS